MRKRFLSQLGIVLVGTAAISVFVFSHSHTVAASQLVDIDNHWAKAQIEKAVAQGYVDGYEDRTFKPDQKVSRAEFVKMVVTATKTKVSGSASGDYWFMPYVNAAVNGGIHQWSDFSTGDWSTPMSRFEMARMADRATGQTNVDDKMWMYLAAKSGLITGMDDSGTLAEEGTTTRAQAVTIIERILDVKAGKQLPTDKHAVSRAEMAWHRTNIFTVMPEFFGKPTGVYPWDPANLKIETPDGLFKAEIDQVVAVDLEDPNDPFRNELPDTLYWDNGRHKGYPVTDYSSSYILYFKSHIDYNTDTSIYGNETATLYSLLGDLSQDAKAFLNGNLNRIATLASDAESKNIFPGYIIPKHGIITKGLLTIDILAPAIPPNPDYNKRIFQCIVPKQF